MERRRRGLTTRLLAITVAIVCTSAGDLGAQSIGRLLVDHVKSSAGDAWDVWTSPFRAGSKDWLSAFGVIGAGAAVSRKMVIAVSWAVSNEDDGIWKIVKPFREGGVAFSGRTITPVAIGALGIGLVTKNEPLLQGVFGCATSYAASSAVRTFVVYPLVARTRPDSSRTVEAPPASQGDQYHFGFPGTTDWGRHSFPGGHIANVAACAGFLTDRFDMSYAAAIPWALVGAVGVSRTLDRRHWLSDEVVGALFGYAVGKEVALRSLRRKGKASPRQSRHDDDGFYLAPASDGALLGWRRTF